MHRTRTPSSDRVEPSMHLTVDGIGAFFDQISRASMLGALRDVEGGSQALPFVRLFFWQPSRYLLEDSVGVVKRIPPDTAIHDNKWLRKSVYNDKYTFNIIKTIVDNNKNAATHMDMRNVQN